MTGEEGENYSFPVAQEKESAGQQPHQHKDNNWNSKTTSTGAAAAWAGVRSDYMLDSLHTINKYIRIKVRSLAPGIDIYLEAEEKDNLGNINKQSVLIGRDLGMNQEEFIISEEGVQLMFTRAGDKNAVLSRSVLQKDQVSIEVQVPLMHSKGLGGVYS